MTIIKEGLIKRLHVNKHTITSNRKRNSNEPSITIQTSRMPHHARKVEIKGPSTFIQSPTPLSCGARVWIETHAEVEYE